MSGAPGICFMLSHRVILHAGTDGNWRTCAWQLVTRSAVSCSTHASVIMWACSSLWANHQSKTLDSDLIYAVVGQQKPGGNKGRSREWLGAEFMDCAHLGWWKWQHLFTSLLPWHNAFMCHHWIPKNRYLKMLMVISNTMEIKSLFQKAVILWKTSHITARNTDTIALYCDKDVRFSWVFLIDYSLFPLPTCLFSTNRGWWKTDKIKNSCKRRIRGSSQHRLLEVKSFNSLIKKYPASLVMFGQTVVDLSPNWRQDRGCVWNEWHAYTNGSPLLWKVMIGQTISVWLYNAKHSSCNCSHPTSGQFE